MALTIDSPRPAPLLFATRSAPSLWNGSASFLHRRLVQDGAPAFNHEVAPYRPDMRWR